MSPVERLVEDAATLGVVLSADDAGRLFRLLEELERWNRRFNLTAITEPEAMVTQHLLDSLSVSPDLAGTRIADAGTGAGFPGLPLAVANPQRQFTLIDSTSKKVRFVAHAAAAHAARQRHGPRRAGRVAEGRRLRHRRGARLRPAAAPARAGRAAVRAGDPGAGHEGPAAGGGAGGAPARLAGRDHARHPHPAPQRPALRHRAAPRRASRGAAAAPWSP